MKMKKRVKHGIFRALGEAKEGLADAGADAREKSENGKVHRRITYAVFLALMVIVAGSS